MSLGNETFLNDAGDYNRKNRCGKNLNQLKEGTERPGHYALLEELQDSRSSRSESKMMPKEMIKLVDSWTVVENKESDFSHPKNKDFILEESIILRAPRK